MAAKSNTLLPHDFNSDTQTKHSKTVISQNAEEKKEKFYAIVFLSAIAGISTIAGFGSTLAAARKQDPKGFSEGIIGVKGISETGASLAMRALGWGTLYAVTGCGILFYGIWKVSGATNAAEFRQKMGSILPRIPKNNPPQSRTEFEGLTDLLTYISEDWGKKKE